MLRTTSSSNAAATAPPVGRWFYALEVALTAFLIAFGFGVSEAASPPAIPFFERDPTISFAYLRPATVPTWLLLVISTIIPAVIVAVLEAALAQRRKGLTRSCGMRVFFIGLCLAQSLGIALSITNATKVATGRWRPNGLAYCNYKGYRDALTAGNLTAYLAATDPSAFADRSYCQASSAEIVDAQASFPSGHAA
jgi:hypothetical protein